MSQSLKEAMQILLNQHPTPEYDADKLLRELLCVFCRDGGQTIEERGVLGAIEVAQGNFYAMNEVCERLKSFTESINKNAILGPVSFSTELKPVPFEVKVTVNESPGSGLGFPAARESEVAEAPKTTCCPAIFLSATKNSPRMSVWLSMVNPFRLPCWMPEFGRTS